MKNFLFLLFTVNLFCVTSQINYNESTYFNGRFETNQSLKEYNDILIDTSENSSIRCTPVDIISSNTTEVCSGDVIDIIANDNTFLHCGFNYFYGFYWQISFNNGASWNWINPPNVSFSTCGVGFVSYTTQQPSSISLTMNAGPGSILIRRGRLAFNCLNNIVVVWSNSLELTESLCTLPVTLISFTTDCDSGTPVLKWTTASEHNSDYFQVERSRDGFVWEVISQVHAAGNSSQNVNYTFVDKTQFNGYYRLKQVDFDGKFEYFNPVSSKCGERISLVPNPTTGVLSVSGKFNDNLLIFVKDNIGKVLYFKEISLNETSTQIDLSSLKPGHYIVSINREVFNIVKL